MDNFDLRKFLAEGKLYEEATSTEEAMDKPSTKMKMSELKAKIRTEILAELSLNEDDTIDFDGGAETEGKDGENVDPVAEATKDGDGEVPPKDANTDVDIVDKEKVKVDVKEKPAMSGVDNEFLDQLEDLQDEAGELGDDKLERQINNTITYFTRQHIAKDTNESLELEEAYDELEENLTKDQIQKKYNEMFGKNPQTKFADVAKALNTTEQEIAAALFSLPMFETDELKENDMDLVRGLEDELKEGYSEFQRVGKGEKNTVARNTGEEKVYGAGVKKGEEIEKKKLGESLEILKMKKLAGLITEGEYSKALLREMEETTEDEVPFTAKVKKFIDKAVADAKADGSFKDLIKVNWFDNELIDELIDLFPDKDYDRASQKVKDYISQSIK